MVISRFPPRDHSITSMIIGDMLTQLPFPSVNLLLQAMPRLVTAIFILCLAAVGGALGSSDIFSKIALNAGTLDPNTIPSLQIASENESSVIFNQVLTSVTFTPRVVTTVSDHVATPHTTVRLYLVALAKDVSYQTLTNVISEHNIINYIPDRAYLLRANIREISKYVMYHIPF